MSNYKNKCPEKKSMGSRGAFEVTKFICFENLLYNVNYDEPHAIIVLRN